MAYTVRVIERLAHCVRGVCKRSLIPLQLVRRKLPIKYLIYLCVSLTSCVLLLWINHIRVRDVIDRVDSVVRIPLLHHDNNQFTDDVTIVTAYFNIGEFPKSDLEDNHVRLPHNYSIWMTSFRYVKNPVVAYFDEDDRKSMKRFKQLRKGLGDVTIVRGIPRDKLWTFRIQQNVSMIFNQPGYPKHYPNTVVPEYACVTASRFELTQIVTEENPFETRYFAWADIGYFRRRLENEIHLYLPRGFDENKVAFTEVVPHHRHISPVEIVTENINWVGGGYFTGRRDVMHKFVSGYLHNLEYFLSHNIMAAEQQLIYAMYNRKLTKTHLPEIQTYSAEKSSELTDCPKWFYLGCLCWKYPRNT